MAEVCHGVVPETDSSPSPPCESSSRVARRRRMELRKVKFVTPPETENGIKRPKLRTYSRFCDNAVENSCSDEENQLRLLVTNKGSPPTIIVAPILSPLNCTSLLVQSVACPKFGFASVCGRRRDMEDAVAIHPSFLQMEQENSGDLHYFGVYDGHGCSHVATKCKERLHELVKEELENNEGNDEWELAMDRSFHRMEKEVIAWSKTVTRGTCRCEMQTPECDAVGSTAVAVVVTPDKIIVANCGDSRAILCRNGKAIPLSNDQKPDRPDELNRIQEAGGRVIYWDGPRVSGVLAMSRAIGDNYLKPYVICEPEVTITDRTAEDDCLILASDGLWDVVSNDTACGVAGMCLKGKAPPVSSAPASMPENGPNSDQGCSDASMLLTKLALARRSSDNVSVVVVDLRNNS
ncbi:probable protein phosphatase 2C 24 isoform X1 [Lycium barbarum]|uniref:probable protein phosphatase 2C 24 isoform X1 n=1 Tax=Lycium barbarum TaxID=112863 RepID=UPI00293F70A0|nr:probable protein phosphatase 2C 24 isoform X1 [Lycium barbarum]